MRRAPPTAARPPTCRPSPGAARPLIITHDENGGCYDHVSPPWGATPPDDSSGEFGFDFARSGPRVPTVPASPLIQAGTVLPRIRRRDSVRPLLDSRDDRAPLEHQPADQARRGRGGHRR
ncbi:alkaline phosphatase family protein [Tsukamurella soli]|uniref:alkaline phosphatase family protein n=1 Tax=Tsukamurella soli TaxID=644556 RepID=UPI0031EC48D0